MEASQVDEAMLALLSQLPLDDRIVLVMMDFDGYTGRQVAKALDLRLFTVYTRLRAARKRAKARWEEYQLACPAFALLPWAMVVQQQAAHVPALPPGARDEIWRRLREVLGPASAGAAGAATAALVAVKAGLLAKVAAVVAAKPLLVLVLVAAGAGGAGAGVHALATLGRGAVDVDTLAVALPAALPLPPPAVAMAGAAAVTAGRTPAPEEHRVLGRGALDDDALEAIQRATLDKAANDIRAGNIAAARDALRGEVMPRLREPQAKLRSLLADR